MKDQRRKNAPHRILIVEDDVLLAWDLARSLTRIGYEIVGVVFSGEEAVQTAAACVPDLVLMDIQIEGAIDGVAAAETIRACLQVPIVYITAYPDGEMFDRAKKSEPYGFVGKPIRMAELIGSIEIAIYKCLADRRVRESEERFRLAMEAAEEGIWDWNVLTGDVYYSPGWARIMGYSPLELEPTYVFWASRIHPDDRAAAIQSLEEHLSGRATRFECEHRLRMNDGQWKWVVGKGQAVQWDEQGSVVRVVGTMIDIDDRRKAHQALQESQEKYRLLIDNASVGILVMQDGLIHYSNPRMAQITRFAPEEMRGRALDEFLHPDDRPILAERRLTFRELKPGEELSPTVTYRMVSEDGDLRWLRFHTVAVEWDGRLAALSFAADVTTLKQAEEKQQRLMKEIEHLAYVVSHDLRAPLINLRGFLKLLESGLEDIRPVMESAFASLSSVDRKAVDRTLSEDVPEALHYMGSSLTHMNRLIDAILRLSRLGRTVLEPVPVSVREIVDQVLDTLGHDILELGIAVAVGDLPDVTADRTALEQIFSNLIGNAVKFRDPLRPLAITIAGYRLTGETAFVVKDTGRGVKAEDLSRIFEVFERSGDRDVPGEGMGLSYVRTLVSKHGGRIWCESTPGEGSTFTFTIARRIDAADE